MVYGIAQKLDGDEFDKWSVIHQIFPSNIFSVILFSYEDYSKFIKILLVKFHACTIRQNFTLPNCCAICVGLCLYYAPTKFPHYAF